MPAGASVPVDSATAEVAPPVGTSGLVHGVVSGTVASGPAPGVDSVTLDPTATVAAAADLPAPAGTTGTRAAIATAAAAAATEGAAVAAAADGSGHDLQLAHAVDTRSRYICVY